MVDEYDEDFYKFTPWWHASEKRSVSLILQAVFNKLFFYQEYNKFPLFYLNSK